MRILRLQIKNFLSYKDATLELGDLTALVGPNASGKSNCVSALRLLREIPTFGLENAVARRGGFSPLRHRNGGKPHDPYLRIEFQVGPGDEGSFYALSLGSLKGKRFRVEKEAAALDRDGETFFLFRGQSGAHAGFTPEDLSRADLLQNPPEKASALTTLPRIQATQSALPALVHEMGAIAGDLLRSIQTVEIDPARLRDLQDPTSA